MILTIHQTSDQVNQRLAFLESYYSTHSKGGQINPQSKRFTGYDVSLFQTESKSIILKTPYGFLYPLPRSLRDLQISIYQSGLKPLSTVVESATEISMCIQCSLT